MEATTVTSIGAAGIRAGHPTPLLRLASDERLVAMTRRGHQAAFEALVARYQARLLAFCRHMLGSREDAEDVLQEVFAAAFNAMIADERPINVRPWLYRIARNRSLNHLRKATAVGVDSMDVHMAEHGTTTAEKVHKREEFRLLMADVQTLPETQRTALLLREIDALSYEQIAEAMDTTIPSIKSLLVRARVSLAEAAEARTLSCEDVRDELGEVAEGLKQRLSPPVRRHLRSCARCAGFRKQLRATNKALAAVFPIGPLLFFKKTLLAQLGTTASAGSAAAAGTAAAGGAAATGGASAISAGVSAVATKTVAGLTAAALVTTAAVEVQSVQRHQPRHRAPAAAAAAPSAPVAPVVVASQPQAPAPAAHPAAKPARTPAKAAKAAKREPKPAEPEAAATETPAATTTTTAPAQPTLAPEEGSDTTALPPETTPAGGVAAPPASGGTPAPAGSTSTTSQPAPSSTATTTSSQPAPSSTSSTSSSTAPSSTTTTSSSGAATAPAPSSGSAPEQTAGGSSAPPAS